MSIPAFGWAITAAEQHDLPPLVRWVFVWLANKANANADHTTWYGQRTIAKGTGCAVRTVRYAVKMLADKQLIEIGRDGKFQLYKILRPGNGVDRSEPAQRQNVSVRTPAKSASEDHASKAHIAADIEAYIADIEAAQGHDTTRTAAPHAKTPAKCADKTKINEDETLARVRARARPGTDDLRATLSGATVPAPLKEPPKAPTLGAPTGSSAANALRRPGSDPDPFASWLDQGAPEADAPVMHCDAEAADEVTEDDTPRTEADARHMAQQAASVVHAIGQHVVPCPAQDAERSAEAQIAAILATSSPEQIAKAQAAFMARSGAPP